MQFDRQRTLLAVYSATSLYRILWAFAIVTLFVPDEYYQTVEPSKKIFDGTFESGVSSTWEWRDEYRIRSFVPLLPYLLLHQFKYIWRTICTSYPTEILVLKGPRLMNSLMSSCSDLAFFLILQKFTMSTTTALFILCVHLFSWSASYCLSRTLANSSETALIIIGLFFWLSEHHSGFGLLESLSVTKDLSPEIPPVTSESNRHKAASSEARNLQSAQGLRSRKPATLTSKESYSTASEELSMLVKYPLSVAVALITITVHCRPTAVLFWAPLIVLRIAQRKSPLQYIVFHCIPTGVITLFTCIAIDSFYYKSLTITPLNFFYINVSRNYAELFYGAKPWHWNFSNGFPVMLGLYTPILMYSYFYTTQPDDAIVLEITAALYAVLLRCVTAHQEFRFLLPCVAFLHIAVGFTIWNATVWYLPSLGVPYKGRHTLFSFCLSLLFPQASKNLPPFHSSANTGAEQVGLNNKECRNNDAESSSAKNAVTCTPEGANKGRIGYAGSKVNLGLRAIWMLAKCSLVIAHVGTAYYLSTRHQVCAKLISLSSRLLLRFKWIYLHTQML
jgi:Alg9-like mannosyltransferase family